DLRRGLRIENILSCLTQHLLARDAEIFLAALVDQHVAQLARVLDDDRGRDVFDDAVEEFAGVLQTVLGALALGDVLMRCHPAALRYRTITDLDKAAIRKLDDHDRGLAATDPFEHAGAILLGVANEQAALATMLHQP